MTKIQLYSLKPGDILINKISKKPLKVYENPTYGTYRLISQIDLIFEYINPYNCHIYTISW